MSRHRTMMSIKLAEESDPLKKPLTITAKYNNTYVELRAYVPDIYNSDFSQFYYKKNGEFSWTRFYLDQVFTLNEGESISFLNRTNKLSTEDHYFKFYISEKIKVSGNIQSLINFQSNCNAYCFRRLFEDVKFDYPEDSMSLLLPATSLAPYCYESLFAVTNYTGGGAIKLPSLPATRLAEGCYQSMFERRQTIGEINLPATIMAPFCYRYMFYEGSITSLELPNITQLASHCFASMFEFCTSLTSVILNSEITPYNESHYKMFYKTSITSITVKFLKWSGSTYEWLGSLYSSTQIGTFYKPAALPLEYGTDKIPENFNVINLE